MNCSANSFMNEEKFEDLIVENEKQRRKIRQMEKKVDLHKNKENKLLFFLFTLQNKGVPVNEIYEQEGIKDIPTTRFSEVVMNEE